MPRPVSVRGSLPPLLLIVVTLNSFAQPAPAPAALSPDEQAALLPVSSAALRANVEFLASDLLEGRGTPSRGLDIAAEYIAAQFAVYGLDPLADGTYFQLSDWHALRSDPANIALSLEWKGNTAAAAPKDLAVRNPKELSSFEGEAVVVDPASAEAAAGLRQQDLAGKIVLAVIGAAGRNTALGRGLFRIFQAVRTLAPERQPVAILLLLEDGIPAYFNRISLIPDDESGSSPTPILAWRQPELAREIGAAREPGPVRARLRMGAPLRDDFTLKNVVGVLPGSDPSLSKTYVLISAHYDHLGTVGSGEGDNIYNGANDDASGTAEVLELARTFSRLPLHPRRTIVFAAWFGEESGLLGSQWYARHPLFPLKDTVANLNFEQVGRADGDTDKHRLGITGFDYSDIGETLRKAGADTGVTVAKDSHSDPYFSRSDNVSLANAGVPAHSLTVMYDYPDYHGAADHWDKLDYANMAAITRTIALALFRIANSGQAPRWNGESEAAARYLEAWRKLHHDEAAAGSGH